MFGVCNLIDFLRPNALALVTWKRLFGACPLGNSPGYYKLGSSSRENIDRASLKILRFGRLLLRVIYGPNDTRFYFHRAPTQKER